jgi:hypothetical protein
MTQRLPSLYNVMIHQLSYIRPTRMHRTAQQESKNALHYYKRSKMHREGYPTDAFPMLKLQTPLRQRIIEKGGITYP